MPENVMSEEVPLMTPTQSSKESIQLQNTQPRFASVANADQNRGNRAQNRYAGLQSTSNRDFAGATPKIGGVLGLRSENVTKKISYDLFREKLGTYVMTEFKNGDAVFPVTKDHNVDVLDLFKEKN